MVELDDLTGTARHGTTSCDPQNVSCLVMPCHVELCHFEVIDGKGNVKAKVETQP